MCIFLLIPFSGKGRHVSAIGNGKIEDLAELPWGVVLDVGGIGGSGWGGGGGGRSGVAEGEEKGGGGGGYQGCFCAGGAWSTTPWSRHGVCCVLVVVRVGSGMSMWCVCG